MAISLSTELLTAVEARLAATAPFRSVAHADLARAVAVGLLCLSRDQLDLRAAEGVVVDGADDGNFCERLIVDGWWCPPGEVTPRLRPLSAAIQGVLGATPIPEPSEADLRLDRINALLASARVKLAGVTRSKRFQRARGLTPRETVAVMMSDLLRVAFCQGTHLYCLDQYGDDSTQDYGDSRSVSEALLVLARAHRSLDPDSAAYLCRLAAVVHENHIGEPGGVFGELDAVFRARINHVFAYMSALIDTSSADIDPFELADEWLVHEALLEFA